jgi:putative transposase
MNPERRNIRLRKWDYSSEGVYFITICCYNMEIFLGSIDKHRVQLSDIGKTASKFWLEIPLHFPHARIDEFVIMPNHIHGIIILDYSLLSPEKRVTLHSTGKPNKNINRFSKPLQNSISVIINQYKSSVKRWCNQNGLKEFKWQPRFYDQILRTEKSIDAVREYIHLNPLNWTNDDLYKV